MAKKKIVTKKSPDAKVPVSAETVIDTPYAAAQRIQDIMNIWQKKNCIARPFVYQVDPANPSTKVCISISPDPVTAPAQVLYFRCSNNKGNWDRNRLIKNVFAPLAGAVTLQGGRTYYFGVSTSLTVLLPEL